MGKSDNLKSNYIFNLFVVIVQAIIPLIVTPVISRILEPDGIGVYSYTYSLIIIFISIGTLGTSTHGQRQIAMFSEDKEKYSKIFYEIFFLRFICLFLTLGVFAISILFIERYATYFWLQIPFFVAAMLDITWLYQGLEKFKSVAIKNILIKLLGLILIFILVRKKEDLWLYILILSSTQLLGDAALWLNIKEIVCKVPLKALNLKTHFKDVMVYFIPTIAFQFYSMIDKVILGIFSTEEETGYYEQAHKIVDLCVSFLTAYNVVIRSRMSYLFAKTDTEGIKTNISKSVQFVLLLALPISLGIMGIASNFVQWFFGSGYEKVAILLVVVAPIIILMSFITCLDSIVFTPFGLQSKANVATVSAAIFNCFATLILIPWLQSLGAVIASLLAEIIILVIYFLYAKKYIPFKQVILLSYKYVISALVMLLGVYILGMYVHGILGTIIQIGCGAIIYFAMILILRDKFVINTIKSIFKRRSNS
ncbi:MAG: oligosaccharide flippase family protein [Erysipelotrichales bacterium]|nr:oligosaccharide flippase family protein [Erysipelotrichales bacterium]